MGPTASGKTDLAIALREKLGAELINVDSAQFYRGLNIGAAKPDADTLARAPHRLIDIRDPAERYSVAEFVEDARREMANITEAGCIPILVGGSMLYFKALREGLADMPQADETMRRQMEEKAAREGWPALHRELAEVDPETAAELHPNHSQRIQRALEVYRLSGVPISQLRKQHQAEGGGIEQDFNLIQLALVPENRQLLHDRISQRLDHMMAEGFLGEVQSLFARGDLDVSLPAIRSVGYRQLWSYCAGECTLDEAVAAAKAATRQLAKRQLTWLRGWPGAIQVKVDEDAKYLSKLEILQNSLKKLSETPIYLS